MDLDEKSRARDVTRALQDLIGAIQNLNLSDETAYGLHRELITAHFALDQVPQDWKWPIRDS